MTLVDRRMRSTVRVEGVDIVDPVLLIRINRLYEPRMSVEELYETTRGVWVVAGRRDQARFALAVYQGEVLEMYEIEKWRSAGSTRWEFTGKVAPEAGRARYAGRSVAHYFEQGAANPVNYVNCQGPAASKRLKRTAEKRGRLPWTRRCGTCHKPTLDIRRHQAGRCGVRSAGGK
jgi:hypothetical protein